MDGFQAIFEQVVILAILGTIGAGVTLLKIINQKFQEGLANLIVKVIIPLMLITSISKLEINSEIILNSIWVVIFAYISIFLLIGISLLSKKIMNLNIKTGAVHILHTTFGNIVFLGFPVLNALFPGGEALLYAALYHLASSTIIWTYGIYLLRKDQSSSVLSNLKNLINPNTIALVVSLFMLGFRIQLPGILQKSLGGIGDTTIYLAMIYIGSILATTKIIKIFKHYHVFILSLNKLLVGPILLMLILIIFKKWFGAFIGDIAKATLVLETAMPCMAVIVILVKSYNGDDQTAVENLFVTTILSLVTLPLVYFIYNLIGV